MPNSFANNFPRSSKLGLKPVTNQHSGFDIEEVRVALDKLGKKKFDTFLADLIAHNKALFCCGHANYPDDHVYAGYERHCVYAQDVENYLNANPNL